MTSSKIGIEGRVLKLFFAVALPLLQCCYILNLTVSSDYLKHAGRILHLQEFKKFMNTLTGSSSAILEHSCTFIGITKHFKNKSVY